MSTSAGVGGVRDSERGGVRCARDHVYIQSWIFYEAPKRRSTKH